MGRNKRGSAADDIYNAHLFGNTGRFNPNNAQRQELIIQRTLERVMSEMAMNRFEWTGLEDTGINQRFLEMCLYYNGMAVVYMDKDYDKLLAVRGTGTGFVNMLDNPVSFSVIGPGTVVKPTTDTAPAQFKNKTLKAYDPAVHMDLPEDEKREMGVGVYPNYHRYPDFDIVRLYSKRLAIIDRTIEINSKNARRTRVLKGTQDTQLSLVNLSRSYDMGDDVLQVTGSLQDMDSIDSIDLGVPAEAYEKLHMLRTREWNEAMGLLGINGANQDKKERLVAAEVSANDEQTQTMRYVNLNAREFAAQQINDIFGTKIEVNFRSQNEEQERVDQVQEQMNKKEVEDGNVHADDA